eukprot:1276072-Prymnesium_polylepis.1
MRATPGAPPPAHTNPALDRLNDDRLSPGLVAPAFQGDARTALVPAPAAPIAQVGGGAHQLLSRRLPRCRIGGGQWQRQGRH